MTAIGVGTRKRSPRCKGKRTIHVNKVETYVSQDTRAMSRGNMSALPVGHMKKQNYTALANKYNKRKYGKVRVLNP